jgi:hypothetical protein
MKEKGQLSNTDHSSMEKFLGFILEGHKTGYLDRGEAIGIIAHVIAAVDQGNDGEARSWFENHERLIADTKN